MNNLLAILSSVLLNCFAQILIRKGMLEVGEVTLNDVAKLIVSMVSNLWLWGAILSYGIIILLWMYVLSKVEVSFAYPFLSIGYVVAVFVGYFWMGESIDIYKITGIAIICFGIFVLSRSA